MALNAAKIKGNNPDRVEQDVIEAGVYPARIVQVIDLGLQAQRAFQGKDKPPANEIMITYELVDVFMKDKEGNELEDKPRWISETLPLYNINQDKANSTKRYLAVDPNNVNNGDFSKIVDAPVNVTLVHNPNAKEPAKPYVNVAGIAAMRPKDVAKCPELKNPPKVFDLDNPDMEIFGSLPEWVQEKIKNNLNFNGSKLQAALGGGAPAKAAKEEKAAEKAIAKEEAAQAAAENQDTPWD